MFADGTEFLLLHNDDETKENCAQAINFYYLLSVLSFLNGGNDGTLKALRQHIEVVMCCLGGSAMWVAQTIINAARNKIQYDYHVQALIIIYITPHLSPAPLFCHCVAQ